MRRRAIGICGVLLARNARANVCASVISVGPVVQLARFRELLFFVQIGRN